eukprot:1177980-Rhodomonas_salina.2
MHGKELEDVVTACDSESAVPLIVNGGASWAREPGARAQTPTLSLGPVPSSLTSGMPVSVATA